MWRRRARLSMVAVLLSACGTAPRARTPQPSAGAAITITQHASETYVGSRACAPCHRAIYDRWVKTPMANVVRDPRVAPDAILPDLATNTIAPFRLEDVALVYGSRWKQRYFTKIGDDYFPEAVTWDVTNKVWRRFVLAGPGELWNNLYPPDNLQHPTGPMCDGCHSVGYDITTKHVVEWNVGCERCHGGGSEHVAAPSNANILNPARMDDREADDVCVQCHSEGEPLANPINGRDYEWPVGFRVGLDLAKFWRLQDHKLGDTTIENFADGTGHKNRKQGNDFARSLMSRRGVVCSSCHDVHETDNPGQVRERSNALCLTCHEPGGTNGPRAPTLTAHTQHAATSVGSECVACHMPKIETQIADVRVRAHTFEFITPAMTDKYGIPNPCTGCHADRSTAWATDVLARAHSPWRLQ